MDEDKNVALEAEKDQKSAVESAYDYLEHFDILETITNVGNDEVFTPRKTCDMILDSLPEDVWRNPDYKWLNPATKNGIFEREIAIRLDKGLKDVIPDEETRRKHILQNMIYAIGLTKFTSYVARRTLYYCSDANRKCDGIKAKDGHYVNGYAIGNGTWFDDKEGNIKTPRAEHVFDKNDRCIYCRLPKTSKYIDSLQREQYAYEFIHHKPDELLAFLQDLFFKGDRNMKFDIIISNPPYQLSDGGAGASAMPIYNYFVELAIDMQPRYLSMIIPSRWFAGGRGLDDFRAKMRSDTHISKIVDFPKSRECFPNVDIAGGVCYFLWERDHEGPCKFTTCEKGQIQSSERYLNEFPIILRNQISIDIVKKVEIKSKKKVSDIMLNVNPFGLRSFTRGEQKSFDGCYTLFSSAGIGYINRDSIKKNINVVDKWKICIGYLNPDRAGVNNSSDNKSNVITKIKILRPGEVVTETYIIPYYDSEEIKVKNFACYLKTKFARFLIYITLSSMHIAQQNFCFVPILDMNRIWTDEDLFAYFELSHAEISFIQEKIREMN